MISARVDDEDEAILRKAKVNLSEVVRKAFHEEARRIIALDALRRLDRLRAKGRPATVPSERIIRELRDAD